MCCSKFFICLIVYFVKYSLADNLNVAEDKLEEEYGRIIHASVLFRHGDRTITDTYPNDPYPPSIWREGLGELTQTGKLQEYELGKWFRNRYEKPLNITDYEVYEVRMDSSDYNRTIMSAELVLAGFYSSNKRDRWNNEGLRWQPVPVHSISESVDNILSLHAPCARLDLEKAQLQNADDIINFQNSYNDWLPYIAEHSGIEFSYDKPVDVAYELSVLYGILFVEELKNMTLPKWTEKVYPEPLETISVHSFVNDVYTDEMKRLKSGPLLGRMVQDMVAKKNHTLSEKIHFYSAHDSTLLPFLYTLGVFNNILVPYGASVLVELRLKNKEYIVTVSYRNSTTDAPYLLKVPGCGSKCTLEKFVEITEVMIPKDWYDECAPKFDWLLALFYIMPPIFFLIVFLILKSNIINVPRIFNKKKRKPMKKEYEEIAGSSIS